MIAIDKVKLLTRFNGSVEAEIASGKTKQSHLRPKCSLLLNSILINNLWVDALSFLRSFQQTSRLLDRGNAQCHMLKNGRTDKRDHGRTTQTPIQADSNTIKCIESGDTSSDIEKERGDRMGGGLAGG